MMMTWWLDNALADEQAARFELLGSGVRSGDAVVTTLRVVGGAPLDLQRHTTRLLHDAATMGLPVPDEALVRRAAVALAHANGTMHPDHVLRLIATRAAPPTDAPFGTGTDQSLLLGVSEPPPARIRNLVTVATIEGARRPADVKGIDRSWAVRAGMEARARHADTALLLDGDDVLEAGHANVVVVRDGDAVTPVADGRLLPGTTRAALLDADIGLRAAPVDIATLLQADEVVLLSAISGVVSVSAIQHTDQPMRPVGDGQPGPWAARAQRALIDGGWPVTWPHRVGADPEHAPPT